MNPATRPHVYGIGNPINDVIFEATDEDIRSLDLDKGIMRLVDAEERSRILDYFGDRPREVRSGGSCPNTVVALAGLGLSSALGGRVGADELGDAYINQIRELSVESRIVRGSGITGSSIILVTPDGERTMNTYLGACRDYQADDVDNDLCSRVEFLYFTGYMWDTDTQKDAVRSAIRTVRRSGGRIVFDVADPFAVQRYRDDFLALIASDVDVLLANREEARLLFEDDEPERCAEAMGAVVGTYGLKLGAHGAIVGSAGDPKVTIPGFPVPVVDTIGAGDMFAAGFLYALANRRSIRNAGMIGNYLASQIVATKGARFTPEQTVPLRTGVAEHFAD